MRILHLIIVIWATAWTSSPFLVDKLEMDAATFEACSTCDARADRMGNNEVSKALRKYMTRNPVRLAIERGDVKIEDQFPNEDIPTGHSCQKRAEARDIKVTAKMVNDRDFLDKKLSLDYHDVIQTEYGPIPLFTTFISGDVPHRLDVTMNIRVKYGSKLFGKCHVYARKTCGVGAVSSGVNTISVTLAASQISTYSAGGKDYLQFLLGVEVLDFTDARTYSPMSINGGCNILFGIDDLKNKMKKYASKYLNTNKVKLNKIRSTGLTKKLGDILKAKIGTLVTIPVEVTGGGRSKRAAGCQRKTCPEGFSQIGNSDRCMKHFGFTRPNCAIFGKNAKLRVISLGSVGSSRKLYMCETDMVPA